MAQQFKMAPENMYICEIKATFTLQVNVGQMDFLLFFSFPPLVRLMCIRN